jgi:hypothetical protein
LKLASARSIAAIRHNPPGALYPVHLSNAAIRLALQVGCNARVAKDAPAATMLATWAIVTMPDDSKKNPRKRTKKIATGRCDTDGIAELLDRVGAA